MRMWRMCGVPYVHISVEKKDTRAFVKNGNEHISITRFPGMYACTVCYYTLLRTAYTVCTCQMCVCM